MAPLTTGDGTEPGADKKRQFAIFLGSTVSNQANAKNMLILSRLNENERLALADFERKAHAHVDEGTEYVTEQKTAREQAEVFRQTSYGKLRGVPNDDGRYIAIPYFSRVASESSTQPGLRLPPLRNSATMAGGGNHYRKMIQATTMSRYPVDDDNCGNVIHEGDCFIISDSGKEGNKAALMNGFQDNDGNALAKHVGFVRAYYRESDCQARRDLVRGPMSLSQDETFYYVSAQAL